MVIILLFILLFCLGIFICIYKNKLTSISIWTTGMMVISAFVYIINMDYFGNDISGVTVVVIVMSAIFYFIGELIGCKIPMVCVNINRGRQYYADDMESYIPKKSLIIASTMFFLIMAGYKLYDMYKFALTKGHYELASLIYFMRPYATTGQYRQSRVFSLFFSFAEAISYVYVFYYLYNRIKKKKHEKILLFPIIGYFVLLITTTGRTNYIKSFIVFLAIMYIIMKNKNLQGKGVENKYVKYVFITGCAMIAVFYLYGAFFRKSENTIAHYFANYFSAGLYGLDYYIKNLWEENKEFGQYTLSNYYYYLNKIFKTNFIVPEHHLPFFSWVTSSSNIYTGYLFSIQDFGYIGMFFTRTLIAVFYSSMERYLLLSKDIIRNVLACVIFGYMLYINFSLPIADRFVELLTVTTFPSLVVATILFNKLYVKSCSKNFKAKNAKRKI